jgi:hypothetical protein
VNLPLVTLPQDLVVCWRAHAADIEAYAPQAAGAFQRAAAQLELALERTSLAALTLEEAATESGYSADHLGRLLRENKIPNAGRLHAPRIIRRHFPRKPAAKTRTASAGDLQDGSLVRSIFASKGRRA